MHLDEERLQRLLDGELSTHDGHAVRAHAEECIGCRERIAAARRELAELDELLALLDRPIPERTAAEIVGVPAPRWRSTVRWAASAALVAGLVGVAYAIPASPLPRWIASVAERFESREAPQPAHPVQQAVPEAGIAVPPGDRLLIAFDSAQAEGEAIVTLRPDAAEVTIRAPRGAATFTTGSNRLAVANAGSRASYTIEVPSAAPGVEIRVAGTRRFLKEGTRIGAPTADSAGGAYRIPLRP
jgi:hypothetical protein